MEENEKKGLSIGPEGQGIFKAKEKEKERNSGFFKTFKLKKKTKRIILASFILGFALLYFFSGFLMIIWKWKSKTVKQAYSNAPITVSISNGRYTFTANNSDDKRQEVIDFLEEHNISLTEDNIELLAALLNEKNFKLEDYASQKELELLLIFYKAEIASQSLDLRSIDEMYIDGKYNPPSFEGEGIPGIIRVNQYRINPETKETVETHLSYIPESEFSENSTGHFTIDESGNLVVANTSLTTVQYEYSSNYPGEQETVEPVYSNSPRSINYKPLISKSSLPFGLMTTLMTYIEDFEFCENMANTVLESNIVLALKEEETETITEMVTTYTPRIEEYYDFEYTVSYVVNESTTLYFEYEVEDLIIARIILHNNYGYTPSKFTGSAEWDWNDSHYKATYNNINNNTKGKLSVWQTTEAGNTIEIHDGEHPLRPEDGKNYTKLTPGEEYTIKEITTRKTYKQELEIKELKNWFMDYNISAYIGNSEISQTGPVQSPEVGEEIDVLEYTGLTDQEIVGAKYKEFTKLDLPTVDYEDYNIIGDFITKKENEINTSDGTTHDFTWSITGNNYKNIEDILTKTVTKATTTTTTITKGEENSEYRKQDSEGSFLYYFDKSSAAKGAFNSATGMILEDLEEDTTTIDQVNILKYLLYLYTGNKDFNVEPIDLNSLVGTIDFASFGGGFNHIKYTVQFSWSDYNFYAKTVDGIEFYKMFWAGDPTIGRGDVDLVQQKEKIDEFLSRPGKVAEGNNVLEQANIRQYMKTRLGKDILAATEQDIKNNEIWIEASIIDEFAHDVWGQWETIAISKLGASMFDELSFQQKNAIIATAYARGWEDDKLGTFKGVYQEAKKKYEKNSWEFNKYIWDNSWSKLADGESDEIYKKSNDARFETFVKGKYYLDGPVDQRVYVYYNYSPANAEEIFTYEERSIDGVNSDLVNNIIELAISKLGCPYTMDYPGRIGPNSFDCSGFIYWLYKLQNGISVPGNTSAYFDGNWNNYKVYENTSGLTDNEMRENLMPGDVLVYTASPHGHVVLYIGNDEIIHASGGSNQKVVRENLYEYRNRKKFTSIFRFWDN